jgi:hypothetical protein
MHTLQPGVGLFINLCTWVEVQLAHPLQRSRHAAQWALRNEQALFIHACQATLLGMHSGG